MARIIILIWGFSQHNFRKSELRQIGTTGNLRITRMRSFLLDVFPWLVGQISDCGFGGRHKANTVWLGDAPTACNVQSSL
jgi:hypothetical protein